MTSKPQSANLEHLRSKESLNRQIPRLKRLYGLMGQEGMISLAGGTPNSSIFPFDGVGSFSLSPPFHQGVAAPKKGKHAGIDFRVYEKSDAQLSSSSTKILDKSNQDPTVYDDIELATALQYGPATGDDRLRAFMREHMEQFHNVGYGDWDVMMSVGNTHGWDAVLRAFCDPEDTILLEDFTFPSALENAQTRGCRTVGVETDQYGLIPASLRQMAEKYRPKLLYTIPTGQNPTGSVLTVERRREVVQIANEFDFIVVEDEPYYYLQMDKFESDEKPAADGDNDSKRSSFLSGLVPSMLNFDTEGRVIRLDSFSKVMAPGIRMGWITAQTRFIQALREVAESSCSKPSGFAQSLVHGLLIRWGQAGFVDWLMALRNEYTERRHLCCTVLQRKLQNNAIELVVPDAGMFFWIKIRVPPTILAEKSARAAEEHLFERLCTDFKVLVVPGHWCRVDEDPENDDCIYFRGTFASADKDTIADGAHRLADALNEYLNSRSMEPYSMIEKDDACP